MQRSKKRKKKRLLLNTHHQTFRGHPTSLRRLVKKQPLCRINHSLPAAFYGLDHLGLRHGLRFFASQEMEPDAHSPPRFCHVSPSHCLIPHLPWLNKFIHRQLCCRTCVIGDQFLKYLHMYSIVISDCTLPFSLQIRIRFFSAFRRVNLRFEECWLDCYWILVLYFLIECFCRWPSSLPLLCHWG